MFKLLERYSLEIACVLVLSVVFVIPLFIIVSTQKPQHSKVVLPAHTEITGEIADHSDVAQKLTVNHNPTGT